MVKSKDLKDGAEVNTKVGYLKFLLSPKDTTRPSPLAFFTKHNGVPESTVVCSGSRGNPSTSIQLMAVKTFRSIVWRKNSPGFKRKVSTARFAKREY